MILQELYRFYERKCAEPDSGMPPYGTSVENISFALVLDANGDLLDVEDLRHQVGSQKRPRKMQVPAAEKKANGIKPNFLWDSTSYVLGLDDKGNQARTDKCHRAFVEQLKKYCSIDDPGLKAVLLFLDGDCQEIATRPDWLEICGANLVFRLSGKTGFIHESPAAQKAWELCLGKRKANVIGQCLISGEIGQPIARLHPSIKGVRGAQSVGASIVSFNLLAFESYGKEQSINAPVSEKAAFNYVTALNALLATDSRQKVIIGDTTIVFWAEYRSQAEDWFAELLAPEDLPDTDDALQDDQNTAKKIYDLLQALRIGRPVADIAPDLDESVRFFVLGLAPNASRLSIRFWQVNDLGVFLRRIGLHFQQLEMVRQFANEPEFPPLWRLLCQTASQGKSENVSPVLAGAMIKAVLDGGPYPHTLLASVLGRIRAEQLVTYFRAALLKAFLIRNKQMEVPVSLDVTRTDRPYLLGRLFAVLEKAQEEAIPGANATIRDRYLGSASATPAQVFNMLLKNSANHLSKIRKDPEKTNLAFFYDKIIERLVNDFDNFPRTLSAEEQGLFMIGYYHQRKDLFVPKAERRTQI